MHGLGHGMISDVMSIIHQIIKKYRTAEFFCKFANPILADVDLFLLSYLMVKTLSKVAWIAKSLFAFSSIVPYLYVLYWMNNPLSRPEAESCEKRKVTVQIMV